MAKRIDRLAVRITTGDVVFFIGAGYSVDSEKNTTGVLLARLLARFEAITSAVCGDGALKKNKGMTELCRKLREGLRTTFKLKGDDIWEAKQIKENFELLAGNYYPINDWMCTAFDELLAYSSRLKALAAKINSEENKLLAKYLETDPRANTEHLAPPDFDLYHGLRKLANSPAERALAGKALFLDTMGFMCQGVMAGMPLESTWAGVAGSYSNRILPRHSVLAWLALEGLLPVVLTTNYDLLLEGAYRMAGMNPIHVAGTPSNQLPWSRRMPFFTPIGVVTDFYSHGDGYGSALIVKIHGDVRHYRAAHGDAPNWRSVLRTMVFTFREIQNWREDSWSRDYLQTLLRTRTVVFSGYSVTDQVIHDTFRSVYEEMARYRWQQDANGSQDRTRANAFATGSAGKRDFHILELLRAATTAAGVRPGDPTYHPNFLGIQFGSSKPMPRLDELMEWIFHSTYRKLQAQALQSEIWRVTRQLFDEPKRAAEVESVIESFRRLLNKEEEQSSDFAPEPTPAEDVSAAHRQKFQAITGWTLNFHRMLFREYTVADLLQRDPLKASGVYGALRWPWYSALSDHPDWGAWAVVIELALRKAAAIRSGNGKRWAEPGAWIDPAAADRAAVLIPQTGTRSGTPLRALTIEIEGVRNMAGTSGPPSALDLLPPVVWHIGPDAAPWWKSRKDQRLSAHTPDAGLLWQWAIYDETDPELAADDQEIARCFGESDGNLSKSAA